MKKFFINHGWWITCILSIALLVAHTFSIAKVTVDSTSIILLAILLISPFVSTLKKIKMGDFEAEIDPKEIEKIKEEVVKGIPLEESDLDKSSELQVAIENIKALAKTDPVLALAKIRIELEKSLNRLYRINSLNDKNVGQTPIGKMIYQLANKEVFPHDFASSLRDIISICNRAIHGEDVRVDDVISIIDIGASLLLRIYTILGDYSVEPSEVIRINEKILEEYRMATYKVTTIIPYVENPVKNIRILDQEGLNQLLEGYEEYAEFIIEIVRI